MIGFLMMGRRLWALADDAGGAGAGGAGAGGSGAAGDGGSIPKERLDAEIAKRRVLEQRIAELEPVAKDASGWKSQAEERGRALDLARAGLTDPDAIDLAGFYYEKLPKADRPSLSDWIKGLKEKPDTAPVGLRGYLGGAGAAGAGTGAGTRGSLGGSNAGGAGAGAAGAGRASLSPEEILHLTPEQYKAQREQILAGYRRRTV